MKHSQYHFQCRSLSLHNGTIKEVLDNSRVQWGSFVEFFVFCRNLNEREMIQFMQLLGRVGNVSICSNIEDRRKWFLETAGGFSCLSIFLRF